VSLFQQVAETILKFRVDVADAKRGLKELQGEEKRAAEASIKLSEAQNNRIESAAKAITKFNVVMKLGTEAINFAGDAWKAYEKHARAAGGADEAKARSFRSAMQTWDEGLNSLKVAIGRMVVALAPLVELAGQIIKYASDAIGFIPELLGNNGKGPMVPGQLTFEQWTGKKLPSGFIFDNTRADQLARQVSAIAGSGLISASAITTKGYVDSVRGNVELDPLQQVALDFLRSQGYAGGLSGATGQNAFKQNWKFQKPTAASGRNRGSIPVEYDTESRSGGPDSFSGTLGAAGSDYGPSVGPARFGVDQLDYGAFGRDAAASLDAFRKQTMLETIFGPPETFDLYVAKFELLGNVMTSFTGALSAGFEAWVSGSKTATEAIKGVFADTIKSIASSLFAHAIEHGVAAIGSLAFGDLRGAALHGKAAAGYAAGAVAVGAIARELGGGGSGGGYAGASGGGAPRLGSVDHRGGAGSPTNIMVVVGGDGNDSPRFRARAVKYGFDLAQRYEGESKTVTYS